MVICVSDRLNPGLAICLFLKKLVRLSSVAGGDTDGSSSRNGIDEPKDPVDLMLLMLQLGEEWRLVNATGKTQMAPLLEIASMNQRTLLT